MATFPQGNWGEFFCPTSGAQQPVKKGDSQTM